MINRLRALTTAVTPIAFNVYKNKNPERILSLLARVVYRHQRRKTFTFPWATAFPQLRHWVGDRQTQAVFGGRLVVDVEPFEITFPLDREDLEADDALLTAGDLAASIGEGFAHGKLNLAAQPMLANLVTYDGQDFFDPVHVHPNGELYSNRLVVGTDLPPRAVALAPTVAEVERELKAGMRALQANRLVRKTIYEADVNVNHYVVLTRSDAVYDAFFDLLTLEKVNGADNRYRGKFTLLRDSSTPSDGYIMVWAEPGGPRPLLFLVNREPRSLKFDTSGEFRNRDILFGMDGAYGYAAAFPQCALEIVPS